MILFQLKKVERLLRRKKNKKREILRLKKIMIWIMRSIQIKDNKTNKYSNRITKKINNSTMNWEFPQIAKNHQNKVQSCNKSPFKSPSKNQYKNQLKSPKSPLTPQNPNKTSRQRFKPFKNKFKRKQST